MKILSVTEAKAKLTELLREVADFETIHLTRNGHVTGVLVNPDEWDGLKETLEILSDPKIFFKEPAKKQILKRIGP